MPSGRKRTSHRRRSARRWTVLLIVGMLTLMGVVVGAVWLFIKGPEAQSASYQIQGSPLLVRLELRQRSIFSATFDRTMRVIARDRQRQTDLRTDPSGYARINLYRQADRLLAVAWGGTVSVIIATGDIEALPGPVLPESPIGYLGAFDLDERKRVRFYGAAECPFVAVAPADRPRPCRGS